MNFFKTPGDSIIRHHKIVLIECSLYYQDRIVEWPIIQLNNYAMKLSIQIDEGFITQNIGIFRRSVKLRDVLDHSVSN